jgi:hypothetical protein
MACNLKNDIEKLIVERGSDKQVEPQNVEVIAKAISSYKKQERAIDEKRVVEETGTVMGSIEQDKNLKDKIADGTYKKMTDKSAILSVIDNSFGQKLFDEMEQAGKAGAYMSDAYLMDAHKFVNMVKSSLETVGASDIIHQFEVYDASSDKEFSSAFWAEDLSGTALPDGKLNGGHIVVLQGKEKSLISNNGELLLHEFSHSATEAAMRSDGKLNREIAKIQKEVMKDLRASDLIAHIPNPTIAEVERAKSLIRYMNGDPSEFLAYAISNPLVHYALANMRIKIDTFQVSDGKGNPITKVIDKLKEIINKVVSAITYGPTASAALSQQLGNIVMRNMQVKNKIYTGETFDDYASKVTGGKYAKVDAFIKEKSSRIESRLSDMSNMNPTTKARITQFMDMVGDVKGLKEIRESGVMQSIMHTMFRQTTDKDFAASFQLIRQVKTMNDKEQNSLKEINANLVHSWFKDVSMVEREAITDLLSADVSVLGKSKEELAELLSDESKLDAEIAKLGKAIGQNEYLHQARDLGWYMMHGASKNPLLQTNAYRIYHRMHSGSKLRGLGDRNSNEMIADIDKLATLYAMKFIDTRNKNHISKLINDSAAVVKSSDSTDEENYHIVDRVLQMYTSSTGIEKKEFGEKYSKMLDKGYSRKAYKREMKARIVSEDLRKDMTKRGWGDSTKVDGGAVFSQSATDMRNDGNRYYMMYAPDYSVSRTQGAIHDIGFFDSAQQMSDIYDGDTNQYEENQLLVRTQMAKNKSYDGLNRPFKEIDYMAMNSRTDHLMPVMKLDGSIVDYSVPISRSDATNHMELDRDIASVLAATVTHRSAKIKAIKNNLAIVEHIIEHSLEHEDDDNYVVLRRSTELEKRNGTPYKYAEQWNMIPEYTRDYIFNRNKALGVVGDPNSIRIHKDMVDDFIGYKDVSIANLQIGKGGKYFNMQNHPSLSLRAEQLQYVIKKLVARYKTVLVILNPKAIIGNSISNLNVAIVHGISPTQYIKMFTQNWKNLDEYNEIYNDLMRSESEMSAGMKGLEDRIKGLRKRLEANPMHTLMKDGQFNMIIEDVDAHNNKEDHVEYYKRKILEKVVGERGGQKAMAIAENIALTKNSSSFKMIEKLTAYNDIINRKIVMDKLMYDLELDIQNGLIQDSDRPEKVREILNYVDQLFVNYSYLDNKYIKFANDVGLLLFTKYFFRALKTLKQVYDKKPLSMTMFLGLEASGEIPSFLDEGPQIAYKDPLEAAERKVGPVAELDFIEIAKKVMMPGSFSVL